jgi:hypothetical protein
MHLKNTVNYLKERRSAFFVGLPADVFSLQLCISKVVGV